MSNVSETMRADWNERAREDAHYYVAFGGRNQDEEGFLATAAGVVRAVECEFKRLPADANRKSWRALEIGCGPGRLMKPLSAHFGEIHGVDVSDAMIGIARERLRGIPHAHVHATDGASLDRFADDSFEMVYSYAVFQHIPSREVVREYMREIRRVLKPGGVFRGQFNGLPPNERPNTWSGVSFSREDIRDFTGEAGLRLLALEGAHTQYLWTTWRKPPAGEVEVLGAVEIRRVTNAWSSETAIPNRGAMAAMSIWVADLPEACDLNTLDVWVDGRSGDSVYVGPADANGLRQVNAMMPASSRTGLVPVELVRGGTRLCAPAFVRVIPGGPTVPRVVKVTDGVNIVEEERCTSGLLKIQVEEAQRPELISVTMDGAPVRDLEFFRTDPLPPRYELNCRLPEGMAPGVRTLRVKVGKRQLMPRPVEVLAAG